MRLKEYPKANAVLQIALESTNSCLGEIRKELKRDTSRKCRQVLDNLEGELVVVSIEAFYLLSVSYDATGEKESAVKCLDMVETYMREQIEQDTKCEVSDGHVT